VLFFFKIATSAAKLLAIIKHWGALGCPISIPLVRHEECLIQSKRVPEMCVSVLAIRVVTASPADHRL
jgi:hypothetical protein